MIFLFLKPSVALLEAELAPFRFRFLKCCQFLPNLLTRLTRLPEGLQRVLKTSQELRMLSSVTINCQITKIVMNSGSQLIVRIVISVSSVTSPRIVFDFVAVVVYQKSENLRKIWKSSKNLEIFQKSENLPKIWKSSKNLKIFQKSENLPKNMSDQMSQWSQVSRVTL